MGQIKKGTSTSAVAVQIGATPRHVRRFWAEFCATGFSITPKMPGRQAARLSPDEVQRVPDERKRKMWVCVLYIMMNLQRDHDIIYSRYIRS